MEDAITNGVGALLAVATALGALRGYDIWISKKRVDGRTEPDNSALMMALGRQQEQTAEMLEVLRRIEAGLERTLHRMQDVQEGVAVLRDRR